MKGVFLQWNIDTLSSMKFVREIEDEICVLLQVVIGDDMNLPPLTRISCVDPKKDIADYLENISLDDNAENPDQGKYIYIYIYIYIQGISMNFISQWVLLLLPWSKF